MVHAMTRFVPDEHPRHRSGRFAPAGRPDLRQGLLESLSAQALASLGVGAGAGPEPRGLNPRPYSGWALASRSRLLGVLAANGLPPRYSTVDAEHVTHRFPDDRFAPPVTSAAIVGWVADDGLEAFVVEVDGTTVRPDGGTYHLTYSYEPGRAPAESNELLTGGWEPVGPFPVELGQFSEDPQVTTS